MATTEDLKRIVGDDVYAEFDRLSRDGDYDHLNRRAQGLAIDHIDRAALASMISVNEMMDTMLTAKSGIWRTWQNKTFCRNLLNLGKSWGSDLEELIAQARSTENSREQREKIVEASDWLNIDLPGFDEARSDIVTILAAEQLLRNIRKRDETPPPDDTPTVVIPTPNPDTPKRARKFNGIVTAATSRMTAEQRQKLAYKVGQILHDRATSVRTAASAPVPA